jgi:5'-deoxynucleotidase YfbR-like HD superfamily hydrolase
MSPISEQIGKGSPLVLATTDRLSATLMAGEVTRYHAVPTVRPQTDALHSWNMIALALFITNGQASRDLLIEIAMHDTGELFVGDVPYTVKRDNPALGRLINDMEAHARVHETMLGPIDLSPHDAAILKICDTLEGFIWCAKYENTSRIKDPTLVVERWTQALERCGEKFRTVISEDEWTRSLAIYGRFRTEGGVA